MSTERPILFSSPMVRAILDGRKTQTRRVIKPQPEPVMEVLSDGPHVTYTINARNTSDYHCPYGGAGDRLWVRETWCPHWAGDDCGEGPQGVCYAATNREPDPLRWRPSIHMPRWASRITLTVTGVRVERVQDITEADAEAEGCCVGVGAGNWRNTVHMFQGLWDSINAKRGYWWDENPWVWVVKFSVDNAGRG